MKTTGWLATVAGLLTWGRSAVRAKVLEEAAQACQARADGHKRDADRLFREGGAAGASMALAVEAEACAQAVRGLR